MLWQIGVDQGGFALVDGVLRKRVFTVNLLVPQIQRFETAIQDDCSEFWNLRAVFHCWALDGMEGN